MRLFRLFISSPGDAAVERRRTESVVSRLNGEFAGLARIETVRWETEFYRADATFQTQIPQSAECDIVVGILRWRLGTELPPDFSRLPDGGAYPSGTAYELLTAIEKRKAGGELPDVFVFRYAGGAPNPRLDDPARAAIERDWAALRGFFARWFVSEEGHFLAAMNSYAAEDDFEQQLETLLRKWLAEKVTAGRVVPWPATKGSPFRGLSVFGARHAPVFFGRLGDIRRAMDPWRDRAARNAPFLLLVGASGAGKSSLARAGLIPRLTTAGVVPDVDLWRVAVMRPGDSRDGPFMALAGALLQGEADLPPEEEGRGPAMPEIAEGDSKTPADLAAVLGHADASAARVIVNALIRIGERAKDQDRYGRAMRCDLVLLIDQLDELFAASLAPDVRAKFADLLQALVASGRVWLIATLRADLYAPMLELSGLKALKDAGASYDLAPPGPVDLAEIVRAPAAAAALTFDTDPETGERLDETLLREADRPDMLPLLQLALSRLWEARETRDGETVLPVAAFRALGGLKGIVEDAGEIALGALGEVERARLPALIRRLAEISHERGGTAALLTARAVPLDEAASDPAARALVDALVGARLLTLSGDGGAVLVRLAHQRVLSDWARAATIVTDSADFYRVRGEVEDQRRRWEAGKRRGELLLARGLPLAEARDMAAKYGTEVPTGTHAFIAASRRRANRAQMIGWTAAAVFAVVALGAGGAAKIAFDERFIADAQRREAEHQKLVADVQTRSAEEQKAEAERQKTEAERQKQAAQLQTEEANRQREEADRQKQVAQRSFAAAKTTVDGLIFNIVQGLRDVAGMRVETIRQILETTRKTVDGLLETAPDDPGLLRSKAAMLDNFATIYEAAGDLTEAQSASQESLAIARKLAAQDPEKVELQRDVGVVLSRLGMLKQEGGDQAGALVAHEESLDISRRLLARDPENMLLQRDVATSLVELGDVKLQGGDQVGALAAYQESLDITRKIAAQNPGDAQEQRDVSVGISKLGGVKQQAGDQAGALAAYRESLGIRRKLAAQDPGNKQAQADVSSSLADVGDVELQTGDQAGALPAYQESLGIRRELAAEDPGNANAQRNVAVSLAEVGDATLQAGDRVAALAAYRESLALFRKLAAENPGNAQAQRNIAVSLDKIGDATREAGDRTTALAAYQESLAIARKLATRDPGNARAQRDVSVGVLKLGNVKQETGDVAGALAAYQESLDIRRKLTAEDPGNAHAQRDVSVILNRIGELKQRAGDAAGALAADEESLAIDRKLAAQDPQNAQAQRDLSIDLSVFGDATLQAGNPAVALAAYQESLGIARKLAAQDPANAQVRRDISVNLQRIGDVMVRTGDGAGALAAFQESLAIARTLATQDPADAAAQRDVAVELQRIGDVRLQGGDGSGALAAYQETLVIARHLLLLDPGSASAQYDVLATLRFIGDVKRKMGDLTGALSDYAEGLDLLRRLAAKAPVNVQAQRDVSVLLNRIGDVTRQVGDGSGALAAYEESLLIARRVGAADPGSAEARRDVEVGLQRIGSVKLEAGDGAAALAAYQESLAIAREIVVADPDNMQARHDSWLSLVRTGDAQLQLGERAAALSLYQESLDIARQSAARDPTDVEAPRDVVASLRLIGDVKLTEGDRAGALATYGEGLGVARGLAARAVGDAEAERALIAILSRLADAKLQSGDPFGALAAFDERVELLRKLAGDAKDGQAQIDLADALGSAAYAALLVKDDAKALTLSNEAVALRPERIWLETNRAHALMLLGRLDEARTLYLAYRGQITQGDTTWEQAVTSDFADLRKAGITSPLMDEIAADFAVPPAAVPAK